MKIEFIEVCEDVTKHATKIPQSEYLKEGKFPIFDQGKEYIGGYTNKTENVAVNNPYIVFGDHTRVLKYVDTKCFIGADGVKLLKVISNDFVAKYIYYSLKSKPIDSQGYARHYKLLKEFTFIKRTKEEQQKIIETLDKINLAIDIKKKEIDSLNELIKSQFIEMFGDPVDNDKQWNVKTLNEITDVRDGTHDSPKYVDKGYPFVTSKNLINGTIDFSTCQLITEKDYLHFNDRSCVDDGDILMPMIGTIGGAIIVNKDRDFAIKNVALVKFTKNNNLVNRQFILNILNSDSMNDYFSNTKKGGTQKFISLGEIRKIPVILPPIDLQNKFASFVEQIDKSKFIVQKQINDLQELLDSKMQEYFGEEE